MTDFRARTTLIGMAQAVLPTINLERMVTALQGKPQDVAPGQRLAMDRDNVEQLELFCATPLARGIDPAQYRVLWAYTRSLREALNLEITLVDTGQAETLRPYRDELDDLHERADELVDSFALAASAHQLLPEFEKELQEP